jgi:hypothetical protein
MAVDLKANFSLNRPQIGSTDLAGGTKSISHKAIGDSPAALSRPPIQPVDRYLAPPPASDPGAETPRRPTTDTTPRKMNPLRQGLLNFLRNVEDRLPGPIGHWVSKMAMAWGGGDSDFGATSRPPIQPTDRSFVP